MLQQKSDWTTPKCLTDNKFIDKKPFVKKIFFYLVTFYNPIFENFFRLILKKVF
jgi:hypothetical protein